MSSRSQNAEVPPPVPAVGEGESWFKHPYGLSTLFFTEMWERLSYYGMRALLLLYMTAPVEQGGLGFDLVKAASIYGWYTMLVYAFCLPGGLIADRWLGQYGAVFVGGCFIIAGQFCLMLKAIPVFYTGLALLIIGTGMLKPNVTSMVGALYPPGDARRDGGFSVYYLGINVGAFVAPFICGTLGQKFGWHWGFAAAGFGMIVGVSQFLAGRRHLEPAIARIRSAKQQEKKTEASAPTSLTPQDWKRLGVIAILFIFSTIFFAALEQAGSSLNLFADRMTRLGVFSWSIPSTWFQALNPLFIVLFAPVFSWLWVVLGKHEPSSPGKFVFGLVFLSFGFLLLVPASAYAQPIGAKVSPWWLVGVYLFNTIGELCLSPVGLSMVTKLAPAKLVGSIMGFWFLSNALGNKISGWVGGYFESMPLWKLFFLVFLVPFCAGIILLCLVRPLKRMMGGVN